jgi:hypothetical protein
MCKGGKSKHLKMSNSSKWAAVIPVALHLSLLAEVELEAGLTALILNSHTLVGR